MKLIDTITSDASQIIKVPLENGNVVTIALVYRPTVELWSMDITYGTREIQGLTLCVHPNILRQWRRVMPFGIAIVSTDGIDPVYQDDFSEGRVSLYVLETEDVTYVEDAVIGVPTP